MSSGDHRAHSTGPSSSAQEADGVPLITWLIGGAALLIVLTAGALLLESKSNKAEDAAEAAAKADAEEPERPAATARDLAPKNPLEITAWFLDAQERSKLWNPKAMLSSVELVVADGKPSGPVQFEFGEAVGRAIPGASLSSNRYRISYLDESIEEDSIESPQKRVALPEPNCPLEVAFSKLTQSGLDTEGRVAVTYVNSDKHGRPVWLVTNEQGQTTSVNADTCALLLR